MDERSLEITWEELTALKRQDVLLVDIRNEMAVAYGMIPGSVHIPESWRTA